MIDVMYYDSFEDSYVLKKDGDAPPERYIPTFKGENGIYIESWFVDDSHERFLNIAFNNEEYYDNCWHSAIVKNMCEENNCVLTQLRYFVVPAHKFDEYVERFGLKE